MSSRGPWREDNNASRQFPREANWISNVDSTTRTDVRFLTGEGSAGWKTSRRIFRLQIYRVRSVRFGLKFERAEELVLQDSKRFSSMEIEDRLNKERQENPLKQENDRNNFPSFVFQLSSLRSSKSMLKNKKCIAQITEGSVTRLIKSLPREVPLTVASN